MRIEPPFAVGIGIGVAVGGGIDHDMTSILGPAVQLWFRTPIAIPIPIPIAIPIPIPIPASKAPPGTSRSHSVTTALQSASHPADEVPILKL